MIYHCFFLHIDLCDWNVLHINYLFIFACKMGALLFSPLVWVIIRSSGEGLSVLETQEASVFLPPLPARAAASAWFPWALYQQLILQFHIAVNSLLLLRECSPGSAGCSEEICTCLCPVPSWPWEPHCWLPEQQAARSCQHSCSLLPGDPLLLGLLSESLAYTVNQDPFFLLHSLSSCFRKKKHRKSNCVCATLQMLLFGLNVQITSVSLFCLSSVRVAHEDISRGGAGDTAPEPVTFCVSGSCTEGTCQKRASSAN